MGKSVPDTSAIRQLASPVSYERGRDYAEAVSELTRRGDVVTAAVQGSDVAPYRTMVRLEKGHVKEWSCTCPYEWGGACKHVVATLLKLVEAPKGATERPTVRALLGELDRDVLVDLILKRAELDHDLAEWLEAELAILLPSVAGAKIDPAPIVAHARTLLAGRVRRNEYWDGYRAHGNEDALRALVEKATPFLEKGDGRNALIVLEAITDSFVEDWLECADTDEDMYELFGDLGAMMAEAGLMGDLNESERFHYATSLDDWYERVSDYGSGDWFAIAAHAMRSGWDDPKLKSILVGGGGSWPPENHATAPAERSADEPGDDVFEKGMDEGEVWDEPPGRRNERALLDVRLRVLDRSGQEEAYLNLARAAAAHVRVTTMLAKLGRVDEALAEARRDFVHRDQSLELAEVLMRLGEADAAFIVAEDGLRHCAQPSTNPFWRPSRSGTLLALWLREKASAAGRTDLALKAARAAFESTHTLEDYRAMTPLAGAAWADVRCESLAHLIAAPHAYERVEILLFEGMIDEAVASVGEAKSHTTCDETLLALMDAAHASHPTWVIGLAERKAGEIMNRGSAGLYEHAAAWLKRSARAHEADGRIDAWSRTIEDLIETHRRKYKLRPLLEALRFESPRKTTKKARP